MSKPHSFTPFFAPEGSPSGTIEDKKLSKEDMINFMKDDDDDTKPLKLKDDKDDKDNKDNKEKPKEKEKPEEKDDEDDEKLETKDEEDDDDELDDFDEPDDEKLELMTPVRRKEILGKYPTLFKDFPYLEKAYYREQQFTELLPTIQDAKIAVEKSNSLDAFEADLLNGESEKLLSGLKEANKESFNKLVDNYLPTLAKVDSDAFYHVIGNVIKNTIISMTSEAKRLGLGDDGDGQSLQTAALILNRFVFSTSDFVAPTPLSRSDGKKDEKEERISEREKAFNQKQFDTARNDLSTRVDNVIKATIESNIDPKSSMTDYVKKMAIRDAQESLNKLLEEDSRFQTIKDKLWESAFSSDFSTESLNKIKSAFLSRAKALLPEVIKRARNEALKGSGKRVSDDKEETPERKGHVTPGRSASSSNSGKSLRQQASEIPKGMKTVDFLMSD